MLRAVLCAAILLVAPMVQAADLARAQALFQDDDGRRMVDDFVDFIATPQALLPLDEGAPLADAVARHFNRQEIFNEVVESIAAALNDTQLQAILDWRATPLGARIAAAETKYEAPDCDLPGAGCGDALARLEVFADPRLAPIRAVSARQNFGLIDLTIEVSILRAVLVAGVRPARTAPLTPNQIEDALLFYRQDNAALLVRWHQEANADILNPFLPDEIAAYADFVATDAMQIYLLAASGALSGALAARAGRMGHDLAAKGPMRDL
ncbi:MAG: hypothetical protein ACJAW4_000134 [Paracoccaceae bacterium]|jgi:hypothetical protein